MIEGPDRKMVLPKCFDIAHLPHLKIEQIVYWDDVHKKCHIGNKREGAQDQIQFPRNDPGEYDPNGEYTEDCPTDGKVMDVKFPQEGRFCFGVAIRRDNEGKEEGVRAEAFDYSGKWILSIAKWEDEVETAIRKVKLLARDKKGKWLVSARVEGAIYLHDKLTLLGRRKMNKMDGVGKATCTKLEANGIATVGNVRDKLDGAAIDQLLEKYISKAR